MSKIFTFKNKKNMPAWLAWLLSMVLRIFGCTLFFRIDDPEGALDKFAISGSGAVIPFWHNRLLLAPPLFPKKFRRKATVLISASRDGGYISAIMKCFSVGVVRGSSSRGGGQALVGLRNELQRGKSTILAVDGPRGPMYTVHPGVVNLASKTGKPIIPVVLNYRRYWAVRSWDKLKIPVPFSHAVLKVGKPMYLAPDADIESSCESIRCAMLEITED